MLQSVFEGRFRSNLWFACCRRGYADYDQKGAEGKVKVEYSGNATFKTVGLMQEAMSLDQWANGLKTALRNDDQTGNVWYTYAELAQKYKGQYIDLQTSANPFGTAAFTDVSDFVLQMMWIGWEHCLAIHGVRNIV